MQQTIRAFVSSTWLDLEPERKAVEELIQRFSHVRFSGMEYFGSRSEDTRTTSLLEVDRVELYIGIFGHRYGSGITEAEYRRARERKLPCLLYFKGSEVPAEASDTAARLDALKSELRSAHTVSSFSSPSDLAARLAADLHHWLFDRYITQGIAALSVPFAERIQNFLIEYTGTADQPIPFGGRNSDLAQLTAWLTDSDSPPLLMLAAPAGRGKSALLVHWSRALVANDDVAVVFFPISIRFNTNLAQAVFPALAARLASLHGEPLQVPPDATNDLWRSLVANYLGRSLPDGRRLLVILDGIDEAADWEAGADLFPRILAPGTRIVVSARYLPHLDATGWARRLGWDGPGQAHAMTLDPLSAAGVADVLDHFGIELRILSSRVDVVAELHRLSEGDPLLVRLYVTSLAAERGIGTRLEPEDLGQIQPGLDGFFTRWWEDQRRLWGASTPLYEPAVQGLLNLLACALGPLQRADLLQLSPADSQLNAWTLEDALMPISRFVIGNGVEQGYAFSHPRLASYFYDRLAKASEVHEEEQRYVAWGRQVLKDLKTQSITATDVPVYLIQYFRAHLERSGGDVQTLSELVSFEWLTAWSALDKGSFTGFLGDVRRIWRAAEKADAASARAGNRAEFLDLEIRCALCLSSVTSMAGDIPSAFLNALVERGVWTPAQGLAYASNKPIPRLRVDALLELARVVPQAQRDPLLGAALSAARTTVDPRERDELLIRVAEWLEEPLAAIRHIDESALRLRHVAVHAANRPVRQVDVVVRALDDASRETDLRQRVMWTQALGAHLAEPHRTRAANMALSALEAFLDSGDIAGVLDCAREIPAALVERCRAEIDRGPASKRTIRLGRLATLTSGEKREHVIAAALETLRSWRGDQQRLNDLRQLLKEFPGDRLEAFDSVLELFASGEQRARARIAIVSAAYGSRRDSLLAQLLEDLGRWPHEAARGRLLCELASQATPKETVLLFGLVATQPSLTRAMFFSQFRRQRWPDVTVALMNLARTVIERQSDPVERARLASDLASHVYLEHGNNDLAVRLFTMALDAVKQIAAEDQRVRLLIELVPFAPSETLGALLDAARSLTDARWTIAIVLETVVCDIGRVFSDVGRSDDRRETDPIVTSALQQIESADVRERAAVWTKRLIGVELGEQKEVAVVVEPKDAPRDQVTGIVPGAPPGRERTAEILQSLEALIDDYYLSGAAQWIEGATPDVALLPDEAFQEVLDFFGGRPLENATAACRAIADSCVDPTRRQLALAAAVATVRPLGKDDVTRRLQTALEIAPELASDHQREILIEALKAAGDQREAVRDAVLAVVLRLPDPSAEILVIAIEESLTRASGLASLRELTLRLPAQLVPRVLATALLVGAALQFRDALLAAIPQPPWHAVFDTINDSINEVSHESLKADALARLAEYADESLLGDIVDALRRLTDPLIRARALAEIVPRLDDGLAERALGAGWAAMSGAADDAAVIDSLMRGTVGPTVRHRLLPAAVSTVLKLLDKSLRARTIEELAPHLSTELLGHALKGLQILRDDSERTRTLTALLAALQATSDRAQVADIAMRIARAIPWADRRATRLAELAMEAEPGARERLLDEALAAIGTLSEKSRIEPLMAIGAAMAGGSESSMVQALVHVERLPERTNDSGTVTTPRATALAAMLPHLATPTLVRAFAIGGGQVASPLERIRLLTFLARDDDGWNGLHVCNVGTNDEMQRHGDLAKQVEQAIGSDPGVVGRLAMLLRDGPLAVEQLRIRTTDLDPRFWPEGDRDQLLKSALEDAFQLGGVAGRVQIARLAPHVNVHLAGLVLDALRQVRDERTRAAALRRLAPFLVHELLPRTLSLAKTITDPQERNTTLVCLLPLLPLPLPSGVLPRIRALADSAERAWLLRTIAVRMTGPRQESLVHEALEAVPLIETPLERSRFLTDLATRLPPPLRHLALESVPAIADQALEADALIEMIPLFTGDDSACLASAVTRLVNEEDRAAVLYAIGRHGCDELLAEGLHVTATVTNPFRRSLLLGLFAPRLTSALQQTALDLALAISTPSARVEALSAIARHAPGALPHEVVKSACVELRHVADEGYRCELARHLWRHLPPQDFTLALDFVEGVQDENARTPALRSLMELTPEDWYDGVKAVIGRTKDPHHRAVLLAEVASLGSALEKAITLDEALASVTEIPDRWGRAEALREMATRVRDPDVTLLERALRAVVALRRPMYATNVIDGLAPRLDERLAGEAIAYARSLDDESLRVRIMASVTGRLAPSAIVQLLTEEVKQLDRQVQRRDLLCALAPCLPPDSWEPVVDMAVTMLDQGYLPDVLMTFVQHIPESSQDIIFAAAEQIAQSEAKLKALWGIDQMVHANVVDHQPPSEPVSVPESSSTLASADLVKLFAPVLGASAIPPAVASAATHPHKRTLARLRLMKSEIDRVATMCDLAGRVDDNEALEMLGMIDELSEGPNRAAALRAFARHAGPMVVPRVWQSLRGVSDTELYASVLEPLALRLSTLAPPQAHEIWAEIIRMLAGGRRSILLDGIRALVPVITALGHQREIVDTSVSIDEVGTWWP